MKKFIRYFVENSLIVNLITITVILTGIMYLKSTNKEAFPKVEFDWVIVETIYPGATASEVEKHITIPLEDQLREVNDLNKVNSYSAESRSTIAIQIDPDAKNKDKIVSDIESAIDRTTDLPDDAEDPVVKELSTQLQPVLGISIINKNGIKNDKGEFELRHYAKIIENNIQDIKGVAKVDKIGYRDREMIVEVKPHLLDQYHVAVNDVIAALSNKNINFPGGTAKGGKNKNEDILIRTIGEVSGPEEIENIFIRANDIGIPVKIKNIATVKDSFATERIINRTKNQKAVTLTIIKKENFDIIKLVNSIQSKIEKLKKIIPSNYEIIYSDDMSYYVRRRLNVLINNGMVGFVLVVLVLFISLGWRISLVTAAGLPLSFAGTFIWMGVQGITVNLLSMFGLIMALGMLVDDAIIVAENIYRHIEEGYPLKQAVVDGTREVIIPVAGTILTTIAAYGPLMFMTGLMGKFIWVLPAVVSVSLIMSWLESMLILPSHIYDMEKIFNKKSHTSEVKKNPPKNKESIFRLRHRYSRTLAFVLKHKILFSLLIVFIFIGSIIFGAINLKFILFPAGGIEKIIIKAETKTGTSVEEMARKLTFIEKEVNTISSKELDTYIVRAGIIRQDANDAEGKQGSNYGMILINLTPAQNRDKEAVDIVNELREKCSKYLPKFTKLEFKMVKNSPPTGPPISVTIKGQDMKVLQEIALKYKSYLKTIKGLKDVRDNLLEPTKELKIYLKPDLAARAGVTVFDVASTVRSCYEGTVATKIKNSEEEIDIRVILPEKLKDNTKSLEQIKVSNRMGNLISLKNIATFKPDNGISLITRQDWHRNIIVAADIDEKAPVDVTSVKINQKLINNFSDIEGKYPGYTVDYEGEFKDTEESFSNLKRSFIIAILVIYIILVCIFRTLHHPLIVMGVIPLTAVGLIWSFYLNNLTIYKDSLPLSFMALLGIVGLAGVIVNDSIVFVDFINKTRARGLSVYDASVEAGYKRIRPIILTSITTIFGLIPTAYGIGGLDIFLVPMAIAMSWGLAFGTLITLFATPLLYNIFYSIRSRITGSYDNVDRFSCYDKSTPLPPGVNIKKCKKGTN